MKKGFAVLILMFFTTAVLAQRMSIFINDDAVISSSTYGFYPNYARVNITDATGTSYGIVSAKLTISDKSAKIILYTQFIDTSYIADSCFSKVAPGCRILLEIHKIKNTNTGQLLHYEKFFIVNLRYELKVKVNPNLDLLINNDVQYKKTGIIIDSLNMISIVPATNINDTIEIIHARGMRAVASYKVIGISNVLLIMRSRNSLPGDRFIICLYDRRNSEKAVFVAPVWK